MNITRRAIPFYISTIAYAALIFYLSSRESLEGTGMNVFPLDKANHLFEFAILGLLLFCSFYLTPLRYAWIGEMIKEKKVKDSFSAFILGSLYGVSDEIHQHFVPRRSSDVLDLVADFLGVLIGIGIMLLLLRIYSHFITSKAKEVKQ